MIQQISIRSFDWSIDQIHKFIAYLRLDSIDFFFYQLLFFFYFIISLRYSLIVNFNVFVRILFAEQL